MKTLVTAVVERAGNVLGVGTNWHVDCRRIDSKTGEGYDLCHGCAPLRHAEAVAIQAAIFAGTPLTFIVGATVHLYGHDHACDDCLKLLKAYGMKLQVHTK